MPRDDQETEEERKAKSAYDLIRMRLNRLERHPEKLAPIPARLQEPKPKEPPEFILNVRGSTAAADSSEFHRIRNARRREYLRLEYMEKEGVKEQLDIDYEERQQERKEEEEAKTARKRAKRLRKKQKLKNRRNKKKKTEESSEDEELNDSGESNEDEDSDGGKADLLKPEDKIQSAPHVEKNVNEKEAQ